MVGLPFDKDAGTPQRPDLGLVSSADNWPHARLAAVGGPGARRSDAVSSRIDHESGEVVITAPVYSTMPVGHRLFVVGVYSGHSLAVQAFEDYLARLALSRQNGHAWGQGIRVEPAARLRAVR